VTTRNIEDSVLAQSLKRGIYKKLMPDVADTVFQNILKNLLSVWKEQSMAQGGLDRDSVRTAFIWNSTPQGYDYWSEVYNLYF